MKLTLKVWRQKNARDAGRFVTYQVHDVSPDSSFLEMLDQLNDELELKGEEPIAFDHDCREGICGMCGIVVNGIPHGMQYSGGGATTCQLHMRKVPDGATLTLEPWRARAFPVIRDLAVDRGAFDRIVQAGGFVSVNTGAAVEANAIPVPKPDSDHAMDAAACIGCGACAAACKNASPMLFTAAKIAHLAYLPQGQPERRARAVGMVEQMQKEGFGNCTNQLECEAACPKEIPVRFIALMNRDFLKASLTYEEAAAESGAG